MLLSPTGRKLSLIGGSLVLLVSGFAGGVWWDTATPSTVPPVDGITTYESTRILPPAPKNRVNVDGIVAESDQPISIEMEWIGDGRVFDGSGRAVSPGLQTSAPEIDSNLNFKSGTPAVPTPSGSPKLNEAKEASGGLDLKLGGGGAYILIILGAIVFLCGPAGFVLGKKIGLGLSATEAGIISLAGVGLIGLGAYPELAKMLVIGLAGLAAAYGVFYVVKSGKVGKVADKAHKVSLAAGRMVKAIDDADTGDGSAGDVIKKAVSASVGTGTELEAIIDDIIADAGA